MLDKDLLRQVVRSQRSELVGLQEGVVREALGQLDLRMPLAHIISGIRRCGKSTLLRQLLHRTAGAYCTFEDTRLAGFGIGDFARLSEVLDEEFGHPTQFFFDEVQNVPQWERLVRHLLDAKRRCVLTGSNASLLSRELGTRLTGRHLSHELFPFSFPETLALTKAAAGIEAFDAYLLHGGFPEYLQVRTPETLRTLLRDVIARDVLVRHKIRESQVALEMALFLITNCGKPFSYNSLRKTFRLGSPNTAMAFVSYFQDAYLLFAVPQFDYSYKKQLVNPKKVYVVDNGFAAANSASFSTDQGRLLENAVFLQLRRRHSDIYYHRGEGECDFVIRERGRIVAATQVCLALTDENRERELRGLLETLKKFRLSEGILVTRSQQDEFRVEGKTIRVRPAWQWALESPSV